MKLGKLLIAVVAATVVLGALAGPASARNISISSVFKRAIWSRIDFAGGFGTVECELVLELTWHSRTFPKVVGTLLGYVTAGTITRCARGGATINRETLPWHDRYASFGGTLPNILFFIKTLSGLSWRVREPTFGVTCQVTGASANVSYARTTATGAVASASVSGTAPCSGISGTLSGTTTNVDDRAGNRLTILLI